MKSQGAIMQRNVIRLTSLLLISITAAKELTEIEVLSSKPTRCTYEHAFQMYGAHCGGLHLNKIPNLRGGIEILDFSDNKLQELTSNTFSGYESIKLLYLTENQIYQIDENAFTSLTSLEILDLSKNVLLTLPKSLLQLPALRTLYLAHNPLPLLHRDGLALQQPPKSPLETLDISDCKFKKLPNWGILPQLAFYNVSHNPLKNITAGDFSQLCNLKKVDLTKSIENMPLCELMAPISWFKEKNVHFDLDSEGYEMLNSQAFNSCPAIEEQLGLNFTYYRCKSSFIQVQNVKASRRTWLTIGGGLAGFLVGFILLLYIMHRRNVAQTKNPKKPHTNANCGKHASAKLINDVS